MSGLKAAVVGAVLALVVGAAVIVAAVLGEMSARSPADYAAGKPVVVALVLPDPQGGVAVRALEVVSRNGSRLSVASTDPLTSATVPGTSGVNLSDAYVFGGGDALAAAAASSADGDSAGWIVVGPDAWPALAGGPVALRLEEDVDVFDGRRLHTFESGESSATAEDITFLMSGLAYSNAAERARVREQVGEALVSGLRRASSAVPLGVDTNLSAEQLSALLGGSEVVLVREAPYERRSP